MSIPEHILRSIEVGGARAAIEFEAQSLTWQALGAAIGELDALLTSAGLGRDTLAGLLGRNRLEQAGAYLAVLGAGRGAVLVNAARPSALTAAEVAELRLAALIGGEADLSPDVLAAAREAGTLAIAATVRDGMLAFEVRAPLGPGPHRPRKPGVLLEIQTSGTTGAPKRIPVAERTMAATLRDGVRDAKGAVERFQLKPKSSPTLMFGPLVHTSGALNTLMSVFEARPVVLFEKFDAETFRQALVRWRPKFAPLPPTAMRMMLDSDATPEDFSSVLAVRAGTAPTPVDLQDAFEARFGVPVLTTYGATEFMGAAAMWTLDDYRQFGRSKRGSVGRAIKGAAFRVVDPVGGPPPAPGEAGILEVSLRHVDDGAWMRTSDLARIDEDGFLYILGRADDAIIRGGFKVMAGQVGDVLRRFPGVYEAVVLGRPDPRLGEVPVAVLEPARDAGAIDLSALKAFAQGQLTAYEVPVRFHVLPKLPRTVSDKVSRAELRSLLDALDG